MAVKRWRRLSPAGLGAVTVLELIGDTSQLEFVDERDACVATPAAGAVRHAFLRDGARVVDEVLLVGTPDGIELHLHGGDVLLTKVSDLLERLGFESGPPDPAQAPARSMRHARALLSNRDGPLADLVSRLSLAPPGAGRSGELAADVARAVALTGHAERLARPAVVRLVGRPNAGKSTLFNAWVGRKRALVSPHPGTTRDAVRATVLLRGVPIELEDTAGTAPGGAGADGADLLVHLLTEAREAGSVAPRGVPVVEVLGQSGARRRASPMRAVSGLTGDGLEALLEDVADALGIAREPSDDAWAPVCADRARALRAAASGPVGPM
jgi:hypothetical protein